MSLFVTTLYKATNLLVGMNIEYASVNRPAERVRILRMFFHDIINLVRILRTFQLICHGRKRMQVYLARQAAHFELSYTWISFKSACKNLLCTVCWFRHWTVLPRCARKGNLNTFIKHYTFARFLIDSPLCSTQFSSYGKRYIISASKQHSRTFRVCCRSIHG